MGSLARVREEMPIRGGEDGGEVAGHRGDHSVHILAGEGSGPARRMEMGFISMR